MLTDRGRLILASRGKEMLAVGLGIAAIGVAAPAQATSSVSSGKAAAAEKEFPPYSKESQAFTDKLYYQGYRYGIGVGAYDYRSAKLSRKHMGTLRSFKDDGRTTFEYRPLSTKDSKQMQRYKYGMATTEERALRLVTLRKVPKAKQRGKLPEWRYVDRKGDITELGLGFRKKK